MTNSAWIKMQSWENMSMTNLIVEKAFVRFLQEIIPSSSEQDKVESRKKDLMSKLGGQENLGIVKIRNSGSFAKGTSLLPLSDLDMVFYLHEKKFEFNFDNMLESVRKIVKGKYPNNEVRTQTKSVGLIFSDGFRIDIVPAYYPEGENLEERVFIFNRKKEEWIETSIKLHLDFVSAYKKKFEKYSSLVRLLKSWNNKGKYSIRSFVLELVVAKCVDLGFISQSLNGCFMEVLNYIERTRLRERITFENFYNLNQVKPNRDVYQIWDPVNPENNIANDFEEQHINHFVLGAKEAMEYTKKAQKSKDEQEILLFLKNVFGDTFTYA
jgi:tRNA nucleotidyltransferase (CCA-adding enzyme)